MAYETIEYTTELPDTLPKDVTQFIVEADAQCDTFYDKKLNKRYPRYVPSEPAQVYAALKFVTEKKLSLGDIFVEWGSGMGVATGLASILGYEATGIEIEETLVDSASALISNQNLDAQFICTSYIPEGYMTYEAVSGHDLVRDNSFGFRPDHEPVYEEMDCPLNEVDLFFVYPWPGEQAMMLKLFDAVAGEGAILVAYYGDRDICLYRKID